MLSPITGFQKDEENHWVADLECGHRQHMRHDPPWMEREWVTTPEGRATRLGQPLNCVRCDELALEVAERTVQACRAQLIAAYQDAGVSGLCGEGRWEAALGSLGSLDLKSLLGPRSLKP